MPSAFFEIFRLLLQTVVSILVAACLLRAYMNYIQMNMNASRGNPLGKFILSATHWIVLPIRKIIPMVGRLDSASIVSAYLLALAELLLLSLASQWALPSALVLLAALASLVHITLSLLTVLLIIYAIASWIQPGSAQMQFLHRLLQPLLYPIQKTLPTLGGIDFSPLVLLLVLQIIKILMGSFLTPFLMR